MAKYRKRPVVIDAWQWPGVRCPLSEIATAPDWVKEAEVVYAGEAKPGQLRVTVDMGGMNPRITVSTLEGPIFASPGDWIIRGIKGELYPCKPDIFDATYEPAD